MDSVNVRFRDIDEYWDEEVVDYNIDIYHLSGWLKSSTIIDTGEPKGIEAIYKNKKILFPLIIRNIDDKYWDATSTYGYGGPIVDPALTKSDIDAMMYGVEDFLFQKGCISWFIRLHPILNKDWKAAIGTIVTHGPTLVSDLTKTEEEHWQETQRRHRQAIKKSFKSEVIIKIEKISKSNIRVFSKIYKETMIKVCANQYYHFNDNYFSCLCDYLPNRILLITAYKGDVAISSTMCTICDESKIMQFHLSGTLDDYRILQPSKAIIHVAREWGRNQDYKFLHLGGGVGAKLDTLYEYKKGFSSEELDFKTHRVITNLEKYKVLARESEYIDMNMNLDFFPIYRKPH